MYFVVENQKGFTFIISIHFHAWTSRNTNYGNFISPFCTRTEKWHVYCHPMKDNKITSSHILFPSRTNKIIVISWRKTTSTTVSTSYEVSLDGIFTNSQQNLDSFNKFFYLLCQNTTFRLEMTSLQFLTEKDTFVSWN